VLAVASRISRASSRALPRFATALLCLVALPTLAHETMPATWCTAPNQTPQIATAFSFSKPQLKAMAMQTVEQLGEEGLIAEGIAERMPDGRCGIVDRWLLANYILQQHCAAATGDAGAYAYVGSSPTFLSPMHHQQYDYEAVQGSCAVCVTAP